MILETRPTWTTCPAEVIASLARIPYFRTSVASTAAAPAQRFQHLSTGAASGGSSGDYRAGGREERRWGGGGSGGGDDGFTEVWGSRRRREEPRGDSRGGDSRGGDRYGGDRRVGDYRGGSARPEERSTRSYGGGTTYGRGPSHASGSTSSAFSDRAGVGPNRSVFTEVSRLGDAAVATASGTGEANTIVLSKATATTATVTAATAVSSTETEGPTEATTSLFSSSAMRVGVTVEDRKLARAKGKITRMGFSNYDATKGSMAVMLSSDDIEFLDEIMDHLFQKAATESALCPLYARLIHELADEFGHFRVVVHKLFRNYTDIFKLVGGAPAEGTETYKEFVAAAERKKHRRGYSQFVAELVKLGEADEEAYAALIQQIMTVIEAQSAKSSEDDKLLSEEYIDCLETMCKSSSVILARVAWAPAIHSRIEDLLRKPRSELSGFSNKGRFALERIATFAQKGWK